MDNPYKLALEPNSPDWPKMITATEIPGLLIYQRETFADDRGFFKEAVELRDLEKVLSRFFDFGLDGPAPARAWGFGRKR